MIDPGDDFTSFSADETNDMVHAIERAIRKLNYWIGECRRGKPHHKDQFFEAIRDAKRLKMLRNAVVQRANRARQRDYNKKHGLGEYRADAKPAGGGDGSGKQ